MEESQVEQAARLLFAAWREQRTIPGLPESCRPQSLDDGYRIQAALAALHEAPEAGYKIGATNQAVQNMLNVDAPFSAAYSRHEVMAAVADLHPAIEIPDSRYEDLPAAGMAQITADNGAAALLVMGPPADDWRALDLSRQSVTIRVNGAAVEEGSGANVLGDPANALVWLANELSARGIGLKAGQTVSTGSAANVVKVEPGDNVVADFGDLGVAEASFG